MRILIVFGIIAAVLTAGAFAAGSALRVPGGGWWPGWLSLPFYGIGVLLALILLLDLTFLAMGYGAAARYFKNALLTPRVVVSSRAPTIVVLGPLGNGQGPNYRGLRRLALKSLPYHAHTPGTRVPFVSAFHPAEGLDRWLRFEPEPIASGIVPDSDDRLILLDEHDREREHLSIRERKQ